MLEVNGDCTLGRTDLLEVETSSNPRAGVFIDAVNPASCSGVVTRWNLCYYNPRIFLNFEERIIQILFQIWRFTTEETLSRVAQHGATVNVPSEPQSFQCTSFDLEPEQYMSVMEGDLLGVTLTFDAALPVVGNSPNGVSTNLLFYPPQFMQPDTYMRRNANTLSTNRLHVTAEIGTLAFKWK